MYHNNEVMKAKLVIVLLFCAGQFFCQQDSLAMDDFVNHENFRPNQIQTMLYGRFGYGFYENFEDKSKAEGRMAGVGMSYEINRLQFGPELDFSYRPNKKFFKRFFVPHFKINVSYRALEKKNHQLYVGASIGTLFELTGLQDKGGYKRRTPFTYNVRLAYRFLSNRSAQRNLTVFPEAFVEYGIIQVFEKKLESSESAINYFWGTHFNIGFRLSLAKRTVWKMEY